MLHDHRSIQRHSATPDSSVPRPGARRDVRHLCRRGLGSNLNQLHGGDICPIRTRPRCSPCTRAGAWSFARSIRCWPTGSLRVRETCERGLHRRARRDRNAPCVSTAAKPGHHRSRSNGSSIMPSCTQARRLKLAVETGVAVGAQDLTRVLQWRRGRGPGMARASHRRLRMGPGRCSRRACHLQGLDAGVTSGPASHPAR